MFCDPRDWPGPSHKIQVRIDCQGRIQFCARIWPGGPMHGRQCGSQSQFGNRGHQVGSASLGEFLFSKKNNSADFQQNFHHSNANMKKRPPRRSEEPLRGGNHVVPPPGLKTGSGCVSSAPGGGATRTLPPSHPITLRVLSIRLGGTRSLTCQRRTREPEQMDPKNLTRENLNGQSPKL